MATGPLSAMRYIHAPIRNEVRGIQQELSVISSLGVGDMRLLADRFAALEKFLSIHESGEETILFPAIDEKVPGASTAYEQQHREMDGLRDSLRQALASSNAERAYALASEIAAKMNAHLDKEEQELLVLCDQHIPFPEQGALGGRMSAHTPPEEAPAVMSWMLKNQGRDDREAFIRMMMGVMPAPAFENIKRLAQSALTAADWQDLTTRIPELAG